MLIIYIVGINILEFMLMGIDKYNAIKKNQRIPEITLIMISLLGGSLGGIIGMLIFRHKTKKIKFKLLFPIFLAIHIYFLIDYIIKT